MRLYMVVQLHKYKMTLDVLRNREYNAYLAFEAMERHNPPDLDDMPEMGDPI